MSKKFIKQLENDLLSNSLVKRALDIKDIAQLKHAIRYCNNHIKTLHELLGKEVCTTNDTKAISEIKNEIKNTHDTIAKYNELIDEINGIRRCKNCGKIAGKGHLYCSGCGSRLGALPDQEKVEFRNLGNERFNDTEDNNGSALTVDIRDGSECGSCECCDGCAECDGCESCEECGGCTTIQDLGPEEMEQFNENQDAENDADDLDDADDADDAEFETVIDDSEDSDDSDDLEIFNESEVEGNFDT